MKFRLFIGKDLDEEVIVYAKSENKLTQEIKRLCEEDDFELIGIKDRESVKLDLIDINCFVVEDNKVFALTDKDKYQLKYRLYQLEESLGNNFVKINQSCIGNIRKMKKFDATFSGTLTVKFKNGYTDYVSRRNLKSHKERLGL